VRILLDVFTHVDGEFIVNCRINVSDVKPFFSQLFLVLTYGGVIQGIFIVLLLNNKGVRKGRANLFLTILLIALTFSVAHILFAGSVINHMSVEVYSVGDPTFYLAAPLLWFYVLELTGQRVGWNRGTILHFLPFLIIIIFSLSFRAADYAAFQTFLIKNHRWITISFWAALVIQFSCYQVLVHRRWAAYKRAIKLEMSNTDDVSVEWVRFFLIVFLAINVLFLVGLVAAIHFGDGSWLPKGTAVLFSLSIFALGYKGILQKEVFQSVSPIEQQSQSAIVSSKNRGDEGKLNTLMDHMVSQKSFLNPELTLTDLARQVGMTRGQLSALINESTEDNFYDFVNKYRVEEVKRLMADPKFQNYNMLGLALESGFKSKSTFNLIFKRFTGLTPSEFRKNLAP
jgi:AraC-like DNA-binding protein